MSKPKIGITTRRLKDVDREMDAVDVDYGRAVARAGGMPILLTEDANSDTFDGLDTIDALLLTGGGDVDPCFYYEIRSREVGGVDRSRDEWELELTKMAVDCSLPVLGICRGCQILNVARGGSLIQHLPDVTSMNHLVMEPRSRISHSLSVQAGSRLAEIVGSEDLGVNTIHHQAVDDLGTGLRVGALAPDGVIECIELEDRPALGVQWHPENLVEDGRNDQLFRWLVDQAKSQFIDAATVSELTPANNASISDV